MNHQPQFYIVSAFQESLPFATNIKADLKLFHELDRLGFASKAVHGYYDGQKEHSFLIVDNGNVGHKSITDLITAYSQECALYVDSNREGYYLFPDGHTTHLGSWVEISDTDLDVIVKSGFTKDPITGKLYSIKSRR